MTDAIDHILECHVRIRQYSAGLEELARLEDRSSDLARNTARQCARYFGEALLLHAQDEDLSLLPRVESDPQIAEALEVMQAEHEQIEAFLPSVVSALRRIAEGEWVEPSFPAEARRFTALLRRHIEAEEESIFPRARHVLAPSDHEPIVREARSRRQAP